MYGKFGKINDRGEPYPSARARALRKLAEKDPAVYGDPQTLSQALREGDLKPTEIRQVELALSAPPVQRFLSSGERSLSSAEINHLLSAVTACGFADGQARSVLEDLLYSVGVRTTLGEEGDFPAKKDEGKGDGASLYIPPQAYRRQMQDVLEFVAEEKEDKLTAEVQEDVRRYAANGVGEAAYILSLMYGKGLGVGKDAKLSTEWAEKAAKAGYPPAYAMLGDLAYERNDYDQAYAYYAKPGAIALDPERRKRMDNLFLSRKFAGRVCAFLGGIYVLLLCVMLFGVNRLALTGGHPVLFTIFAVLMTGVMALVVYAHNKMPLKDLRHWGLVFLLLFTLYLVIALL